MASVFRTFYCILILISSHAVFGQLETNVLMHDSDRFLNEGNENCTGVIKVSALGNSGPFLVEIIRNSDNVLIDRFTLDPTLEGERDLTRICDGSYTIKYTNRFGCEFTDNTTVTGCGRGDCCADFNIYEDALSSDPDPGSCGSGEGCKMGLSVTTTPGGIHLIGGAGETTTYQWSNGQSGRRISNLCSGTYTVTATNSYGCSSIKSFDLCCIGLEFQDPQAPTIEGGIGSISYEFYHDLPLTSLTINGENYIGRLDPRSGKIELPAGTYSLSFETIAGCKTTEYFTIPECTDLGPDTEEVLPATASPCGARVDVSMTPLSRFTYEWSDERTNPIRTLSCGENYPVTITDRFGCGEVVREFYVCPSFESFNLNEYITSSVPASAGGNDGQVNLTLPPEFTPYLMEVFDETTSMPVAFSSFQFIGSFRMQGLSEGLHQLRFIGSNGCSILATIDIASCSTSVNEDDVVLKNIRSIGEFYNSQATPVQIIADVEISAPYENYPFQYQLIYQHVVKNNNGNFTRFTETLIRDSPEFLIPDLTSVNGLFPTIRVLHPCTEEVLSQIKIENLTSCTSPVPFLVIQDQCATANFLTPTWYKVRGLLLGEGFFEHRISVGDNVTVTREYRPQNSGATGHSVTYKAKIEEIGSSAIISPFTGMPFLEAVIFGHDEKHKILNRDIPGILTVTIMLEDGSCLEPESRVIGSIRQGPIPHILGGGHSLSETRLFRGIPNDFWLGYIMNCTACWGNSNFFDGDYRDNDRCTGDDRIAPFTYLPEYPDRPCTGGGTLVLPPEVRGSAGSLVEPGRLIVYPSPESRLLTSGSGLCGCIFDPEVVEWPDNGPTIGPTLKVYVDFECEPDTNDDGPDTEVTEEVIETLCERYGVARECEDCDVVPSGDGCSLDLICLEDDYILKHDVQRDLEGAHQGGPCFISLPDNNIQGLYDIHIGIPCEASPCEIERWSWIEEIDAITSFQVEMFRETSPVPECPEHYYYCGFQSGDIGSLVDGGLDNYYYKSFEQDEFSSPTKKEIGFVLFPNPASERGGSITLIANRSDITEWKVFDMYGQTLTQGKESKVVGNNSQLSFNLGINVSKMIFVQVWLSSGEHYVNKIIVTR